MEAVVVDVDDDDDVSALFLSLVLEDGGGDCGEAIHPLYQQTSFMHVPLIAIYLCEHLTRTFSNVHISKQS